VLLCLIGATILGEAGMMTRQWAETTPAPSHLRPETTPTTRGTTRRTAHGSPATSPSSSRRPGRGPTPAPPHPRRSARSNESPLTPPHRLGPSGLARRTAGHLGGLSLVSSQSAHSPCDVCSLVCPILIQPYVRRDLRRYAMVPHHSSLVCRRLRMPDFPDASEPSNRRAGPGYKANNDDYCYG
jgi:hypothetical protein